MYEITFEFNASGVWRYTCSIPYCAAAVTKWHDTTTHKTLTRGAWLTEGEAVDWARANLNGAPYSISRFWGVR